LLEEDRDELQEILKRLDEAGKALGLHEEKHRFVDGISK